MSRRHRLKGKLLNRPHNQRKALFKGLINSLILEEEIKTTSVKAKAVQGLFDKLVTRAKLGTIHARRLLHAFLGNKKAVNKLVDELSPRVGKRPGGFTRIIKLGRRRGDDAPIVKMEIVDKPQPKPSKTAPGPKPAPKTVKK